MGKRKLGSKAENTNHSKCAAVTDTVSASKFSVERGPWVKLRRLTLDEITAAIKSLEVGRNSDIENDSDDRSDCEVIKVSSSRQNGLSNDVKTTSSSKANGRRVLRQRVQKKIVYAEDEDEDSGPSATDDKKDDDYKRESSEDEDDDVVSEVSVDDDTKYDSDWTGSDNVRTMKYNRSLHKRSTELNLRQKSGHRLNYAEDDDSDSGLDDLVPVVKEAKKLYRSGYPVKITSKGRPYLTILTFGKKEYNKFDESCRLCKEIGKGVRLYCNSCTWVLHPLCLTPPLKNVPGNSKEVAKLKILCPRCICKPILGDYDVRPSRILSMRCVDKKKDDGKDSESDENDDSDDSDVIPLDDLNTNKASAQSENKTRLQKKSSRIGRQDRQFFVHLRGKSHWDCCWASEIQMRVYHTTLYFAYLRKLEEDSNDPSASFTLDVSNEDEEEEEEEVGEEEDDDLEEEFKKMYSRDELMEKYYKYSVLKPWLRIQRVINHKEYNDDGGGDDRVEYLVKWRDLDYSFCSWEEEETANKRIPGFKKAVEVYKEHREVTMKRRKRRKTGRNKRTKIVDDEDDENDTTTYKHVFVPPKTPVTDLSEKYDVQPEFVDPKNCGLVMYDYQLEGLNWLRHSWSQRTSVILADEMGLGKTIQAILFLYSLYKEGHCDGPFIISAPLSTIINWERELETWAPDFYVITYTGVRDTRSVIRVNDLSYDADPTRPGSVPTKLNGFPKFNVLLTSHDMIVVDSCCLWSIPWQVLIVDEGHRLRDCDAKFFRYVNQYDTKYKLVLTGTPLQNNLEELFHLLNFLSPDKFNDLSGFQNEFTDVSKEDQVTKLHELLGPHLLRRLKADVLKSLPSKSELIVTVELSPTQKKYYKYILTKNFSALNSKGVGKSTSLLNIMMDLRKCCNHPYCFSRAEADAPMADHLGEEDSVYEINALTKASGKLILLQKMLKLLKSQGHRVLIFSQFTMMLDILEDFLDGEGYKYERIDGRVHGKLRQEAIDRFNAPGAEQFVFLLSTRAGGLGINLATADTVIVYDSDWNPHNDIQAFSRAHRIGQVNKVMIYRFVTKCSVEERIAAVAKKKMMLTHLVVRPGMGTTGTGLSYTKQEMEDIIRYGTEELFKSDEQNEDNVVPAQYTDEMIQKLLDRNQKGTSNAKETFFNEYLSKFKVVNYTTNDDVGSEETDMDIGNDLATSMAQKVNHVYWEELLGRRVEQEEQKKQKADDFDGYILREKRIRKQVPVVTITEGDLK